MDEEPNITEPRKPRRRWFQFRLRTLLVGIALIGTACGYVAHEARIVESRKAWLRNHILLEDDDGRGEFLWLEGNAAEKPSLIRRWLGDDDYSSSEMFAYWHIILPIDTPQAEIDGARLLFPEATIAVDKPWRLKP